MKNKNKVCTFCVMDYTDSDIYFSESGRCNHCRSLTLKLCNDKNLSFNNLIYNLKSSSKDSFYDCILGVSGGVDSCYTAVLLKTYGINPLLVHIDNGWNTDLAYSNIKNISKKLKFDLEIVKLNSDEFYEIQKAFLKSNIIDVELPTDLAIQAVLHKKAVEHNIKNIVSGGNYTTEGILPLKWGYHPYKDMKLYKYIVKKYSNKPLKDTPTFGFKDEFYFKFIKRIKTVYPLNIVNYNREIAIKTLCENYNWINYDGKHKESIYTDFIQSYLLPTKWNVDYRKANYSSLICHNQLKRNEALVNLLSKPYSETTVLDQKNLISQKLSISLNELDEIIEQKGLDYTFFPNNKKKIHFFYTFYRMLKK